MTKALNGGGLPLSGGTMEGDLILNADPTVNLQAATKQYVDAVSAGFNFKEPCVAASTTALTVTYANGAAGVGATLTNAGAQAVFSIDGVSPGLNSRILIKDQGSTFQNGIYIVTDVGSVATNWILERATDYDQPVEIQPGDFIIVTTGTVNAGSAWLELSTVATIGTDPITFSQFGASGFAPSNAPYIVQTPSGSLSNEQAMSALATGLVKNTTATGVQSIAVNGTDYYGPGTATPVPVTEGGSGRATGGTAYGIVAVGTTATAAQQTISPGTTGQALVSAGAAALPAFGTLGANGGGTGRASHTAYAVICGGTTSTNPQQSIASVGTSGQVLTSNGAGALPTFQTAGASSGNWVLLATVAASASANVDFTTNINTTYDEYVVLSDQIVFATNGVNMQLRVSIAATFQTGANYNYAYGYIANNGTNATGSASGTFAIMNGFTLTNSANYTNGFELSLKAPGSTSYKNIQWWFTGPYSVDNRVTMNYGGLIFSGSTSAIDGLRFYSSSGNITSGNFYLYGIKKT